MNVAWQQQKKKIHVSAYSPLGANGAFWGSLAVMESPILKQVVASTNKTIAQVGVNKTQSKLKNEPHIYLAFKDFMFLS